VVLDAHQASEGVAIVTVKAYQGADGEMQRQLIPERPGLYVWTHNLGRLVKADEPTIQSHLLDVLAVVGRPRTQAVRPYYEVTVSDRRHEIHSAKRLILHSRLNQGDDLGVWIADLATQIQRPLYIGMALNLHKRINEHLNGRSDLRGRLRSVKPKPVDMLDLAITWVAAPVQVEAAAAQAEGEPDATQDPDEAEGGEPSSSDDQLAVGSELDSTLKAAESLLIRLAMPMFNEKQD
jgi:hypothetical protein